MTNPSNPQADLIRGEGTERDGGGHGPHPYRRPPPMEVAPARRSILALLLGLMVILGATGGLLLLLAVLLGSLFPLVIAGLAAALFSVPVLHYFVWGRWLTRRETLEAGGQRLEGEGGSRDS